jgi:hypothetical protein
MNGAYFHFDRECVVRFYLRFAGKYCLQLHCRKLSPVSKSASSKHSVSLLLSMLGLLSSPEERGAAFLRNVAKLLSQYVASFSRRRENLKYHKEKATFNTIHINLCYLENIRVHFTRSFEENISPWRSGAYYHTRNGCYMRHLIKLRLQHILW